MFRLSTARRIRLHQQLQLLLNLPPVLVSLVRFIIFQKYVQSFGRLARNFADLLIANGRIRNAEMVTIRAMGQTFVVKNHLPPTPTEPSNQPSATFPLSVSPTVAMATSSDSHNNDLNRLSNGDDELTTVCEESSPPQSNPSTSSSSESPVAMTTTAATTCADQSDDYQDFLSKFGILNLPLHPSLDRQSVTQIDSPDDTLVSGSLSPLLDQLDPLLTPDVPPSTGGKCLLTYSSTKSCLPFSCFYTLSKPDIFF